MEAAGAYVGIITAGVSQTILPWALLFCGGAMLYVISQEMIPESHTHGKERIATFSLIAGLMCMVWLTI